MVPDRTEPGWPFSAPMGTYADVEGTAIDAVKITALATDGSLQ